MHRHTYPIDHKTAAFISHSATSLHVVKDQRVSLPHQRKFNFAAKHNLLLPQRWYNMGCLQCWLINKESKYAPERQIVTSIEHFLLYFIGFCICRRLGFCKKTKVHQLGLCHPLLRTQMESQTESQVSTRGRPR